MNRRSVTLVFCVAFFVMQGFAGTAAYAQSETGNISGVVASEAGAAALAGASVRIEGLNRKTTTDSLGRYRFTGLPVGEHRAIVEYFGADPFEVSILVQAGENAGVDLYATREVMDEIVVRGVLGSIYASRARERAADGFKSVIAADAVGQFGDQNIAEALQRMPAVTISRNEGEGNYVSVRGLAPRFNQITLNGMEIGTDGESRGTSLQFVGTNMLEAVEITKSVTPDMSANAMAGQINIESASAFRKGENSLTVTAEGSYQDDAAEVSPKITASGTWLNQDDTFGIAYAFNYYDRSINGNEYVNDDGLEYWEDELYDDTDGAEGNRFLMPGEFNPRREIGQRERYNFNLGLEFRPTDQDEFFFHGTIAQVHDEDLKIREVWELDDAGSGSNEVVEIGPNSFVLTDVDIATDLWWQDIHNDSYAFDFGGTHTRGDWTTEYKLGTSESRSDRTGSARAQWRERDNAVRGTWWRDGNTMEVIPFEEAQLLPGVSGSDVRGNALDYSNFDWMRAWFDDSLGGDEIHTARIDITKDLFIGDASGFVKFGVLYTDRSVDKDNNRPQFDPTDGFYEDKACGGDPECEALFSLNMDDFGPLAIPENSIKQVPTPSWGDASPIIERMRPLMPIALAGELLRDDFRRDYTADETVSAAYLMGNFDVTEKLRVIGGVRVENTDFSSTGYLTIRNDDFPLPGAEYASAVVHDLGKASKSYTDVFPSLTVRYEPNDEVVIRGSITRTTNRPDFSLVKNSALYSDSVELFNTELDQTWEEVTEDCQDLLDDGDPLTPTCTELTLSSWAFDGDEFDFDPPAELSDAQWAITQFDLGGTFEIGNPDLNPMMSTNFDVSVGWYPSRSTYLSVAVYRKDITDWIAPIRLRDVTFGELPVSLPDVPELAVFQIDNDTVFERVEVALNGEEAQVDGIEFAFSHSFDNGFFIDGNAAFMDSWATLLSRTEKLPLISQSDMTANLSLGYQNEVLTMRVVGNHRGEYLVEIGEEADNDAYGVPYTAVDFNVRWDVNENMQLYFDAINLTDEQEAIEWQGDEISGPMYYEIQDYGKTYQLGMRYTFDM